jgi:hypothetical protein
MSSHGSSHELGKKSGFIIPGKLSTAAKDGCNSPYLGAHIGLGRSCEVDCKHLKA